jgi:hypothetical protein
MDIRTANAVGDGKSLVDVAFRARRRARAVGLKAYQPGGWFRSGRSPCCSASPAMDHRTAEDAAARDSRSGSRFEHITSKMSSRTGEPVKRRRRQDSP